MKEMIRYGLILGIICLVASGLLAGMNSLTKARIIAQAQGEEQAGLKEVMPLAENFEEVESESKEVLYYKALDGGGRFIGVAFKASGKGYSSTIETIVGMTKEGEITSIKIISQNETPGLGTRVTEASFFSQFSKKKIEEIQQVDAITGATISSNAVKNSIKEKAKAIKELIKNE